jgi:hypothetical protein
MKIIASILLLIASFSAFSADNCSYEVGADGQWAWVCK